MAKKALVIGINNYGFPNDLPSSARDADAFANVLETVYRFEQIRVLKDSEATRDGVDRGLEWLFENTATNDRLVVYFSGHGCRFEKNGVIEEALVLQDGRLIDDRQLADGMDNLPSGILTVVLDCCFSGGFEEMLPSPSGQVEVTRLKRWIPTDHDRGRHDRAAPPGLKAFSPFGHMKPAPLEAMMAHVRGLSPLDPSPARLISLPEPQAKAVLVLPCLGDEGSPASTSQTGGLSVFTFCLLNAIRRFGPNRSAIEVLSAAGHELRRLGLRQTPLVKEPLQPEHLALRSFLTFQPVLFVYPQSTPGREGDEELTRSIAEAVRNTLITSKEGRSMHATIPGGQTLLGDDIGTIVNTVTPIVASVLQSRVHQPYAGATFSPLGLGPLGSQGWPGTQGWWQGGLGQRGLLDEIGQVVGAVIPAVLPVLQSRQFSFQPFQPYFQPFQWYSQPFHSPMGPGLQPYEIAQIVTPIVASLVQSRAYQGHFGQTMPRAA